MKHLLCSLFLILTLSVSGQLASPPDDFWMINDGRPLKSNGYLGVPVTPSFQITNQHHPNSLNTPLQSRNDVFIIYADGSYFNSRNIPRSTWALSDHPATPPTAVGYNINGPKPPIYMYFTNVYEGDEDPVDAIANGNSGGFLGMGLPPFSAGHLSFNHDVSLGDDITVIIDHKKLETECDNFRLCYDRVYDGNTIQNLASAYPSVNLLPSPVFDGKALCQGVGGSLQTVAATVNSNCVNIPNVGGVGYSYFALRIPETVDPQLIGDDLLFRLESADPNCTIITNDVPQKIVTSNDPNFIRVKCIEIDNEGNQYVRYYAQCYNDGDDPATEVSMHLPLPPFLSVDDIRIDDPMSIQYTNNPVTRDLQSPTALFKFGNNLNSNPDGKPIEDLAYSKSYAAVEFCIPVKDGFNVDLQTANLQPTNPYTVFDSKVFAIETYYDPVIVEELYYRKIQSDTLKLRDTIPRPYGLVGWTRPFSDDCGCGSDTPPDPCPFYYLWCNDEPVRWPQLIFTGLLLLFVVVGIKKVL